MGLAAYILEKFSTWTDLKNRDLADGGLEKYMVFPLTLLEKKNHMGVGSTGYMRFCLNLMFHN